jgi:release factor glutamine methyltransferase
MRISSNHIRSIINFFYSELEHRYSRPEINRLVEIVFEAYHGYSRTELLKRVDETVNESDLLRYNFAAKDLKKGKPVQYVIGKAWFFDLTLMVNEHVLIPRPETEELVQWIADDYRDKNDSVTITDAGTGSGCIPIALARKLPGVKGAAFDVSDNALAVAKHNAAVSNATVNFFKADMLDAATWNTIPQCDVLVSNPPYIRQSEAAAMDENVTAFEPHLALFVPDEDALLFYKALAQLGKKVLKPGGALYVEINEALGEPVVKLFEQDGYNNVELRNDLSGKPRMVKACRG